jgi:hypothetical protein
VMKLQATSSIGAGCRCAPATIESRKLARLDQSAQL